MWRLGDADTDMFEVTEMVACRCGADAIFRGVVRRHTAAHISAANRSDARRYRRHRQLKQLQVL